MPIRTFSLLLGLLLAQQAFSTAPTYKDSTIPPQVSKWSQQQFLDAYGTDDTSRALVRYYFSRKKKARNELLFYGVIGIAAGLAFEIITMSNSNIDVMGALFIGILLGSALYVAGFMVLIRIVDSIYFSRRRLAKQLGDYMAGKPLRRSTYRNRKFPQLLTIEKEARLRGG